MKELIEFITELIKEYLVKENKINIQEEENKIKNHNEENNNGGIVLNKIIKFIKIKRVIALNKNNKSKNNWKYRVYKFNIYIKMNKKYL